MKTIEEAAIECANIYLQGYRDSYPADENDFVDVFEAGIEFAQRWIPVGEELPPLDVPITAKYILFNKECYWSGILGSENRRKHFIESHLMITHWRLIDIK